MMITKSWLNPLPFALAAMVLFVTGCPDNRYIVQLKPHGGAIERTLEFYREDGMNTNTGLPNYQAFDQAELAAIIALYPAGGLKSDGDHHVARGTFSHVMPHDVGGCGAYTNL